MPILAFMNRADACLSDLALYSKKLFCRHSVAILAMALPLSAVALGSRTSGHANSITAAENYGKMPLHFEANQGQSPAQVRFVSRGEGYSLFLTDSGAVLDLTKRSPVSRSGMTPGRLAAGAAETDVLRMETIGASHVASVSGLEQLAGKANYLIGNDPGKWHTNIPTYRRVKYAGVYPGVDLTYYGNQQQLEYDFVVAPGADANAVKLHFTGAEKLMVDRDGSLKVVAKHGEIAFLKPVVYQLSEGRREAVDGRFRLMAGNCIGFTLGRYDASRELVIDPVLAYSTYLGGSWGDSVDGIAVDSAGNAYVAGSTGSTDFPVTSGSFQTISESQPPELTAFISKINPEGTALIYSTYLGGKGALAGYEQALVEDFATGIAVDASGNAYVTGQAGTTNFPVTPDGYQRDNAGSRNAAPNAFVAELNPTGSALIYSTYLGGSGEGGGGAPKEVGTLPTGDMATGIALDSTGSAYVVGIAYSTDFPVSANAFQKTNKSPFSNAFIAKFSPTGSRLLLVYSTYLGGSEGFDTGTAIAADAAGNAYVTGTTGSNDFPVSSNAFQKTFNVPFTDESAFVSKINATGSALVYSSFLSGSHSDGPDDADGGTGIAVDSAGNAFVTGFAISVDFPVTSGAFQQVNKAADNQVANAFVTKINPAGSGLIYSTYLGGSKNDAGTSIAVDATGDAYLTGTATSSDYPVTSDSFQSSNNASGNQYGSNAFATELNAAGSALLYSTYLGGSGADNGSAIAVDSEKNIYVAGSAGSNNFPVSSGALQGIKRALTNGTNGFVAKFASASTQQATTSVLTSENNPQRAGYPVTFTLVVSAVTGGGTPTGFASFSVDGNAATKLRLDDTGRAVFGSQTLTAGVHSIAAFYSGDATYSASNSNVVTETIAGTPATIAVVSGSGQSTVYGSVFSAPLVAVVKDVNGVAIPAVVVSFSGPGLHFNRTTEAASASGEVSVSATAEVSGILSATASVGGASTIFTLTATKGVLTVAAKDISVPYGQAIPALTDTITGFLNGDKPSVVTGAPSEASTAKKGSVVGTYPITLSAGTLAAANYSFNFVGGTVKVAALGTTAAPRVLQVISIVDSTPGATVYFTLDGTIPTKSSHVYAAPITISTSDTLKFFAVTPGYADSPVTTVTDGVQ